MSTWGDEEKVTEYLGRVDRLAARRAGEAIGLDRSAPMLDHARGRFAGDARVQVANHDMTRPLPALGMFDAVVSGFANLEVVACATPELHEEFNRLIGRPGGDPEDILAGVDEQVGTASS